MILRTTLGWTISMAMALLPAALANSTGPDARNTGAPGDSANACASSGCHTSRPQGGPINSAGGSVRAVFSTGDVYYAGVPVVVTVTVTDPVNRRFGFQMTARQASNPATAQAGTFTAGNSTMIVICQDNRIRGASGCPAAAPIEFIEHGSASPAGSSATWQFTWTPAANQSGPVSFYVAGNAVNSNGNSDGGDNVYTASYTLNPAVCTQVTPTITSVTSGSDFGELSNIAAGSWIEIKGANLANGTRVWEGRDFLYANAPTSVDGVRATVNDRPAFVFYVSPVQINVQAPVDPITGISVAVRVTTCGGTSAAFNVNKTARAPGLLAHPLWMAGGRQHLTALHNDGVTFVGMAGMVQGVPMRPARPGDTITAYGIGFGDVNPTSTPVAGVVVSQLNQLASSFNLTLGSTPVTQVPYAGLAPNFVGLYQFNFVIPDVPDGEHQITGTLAGTALQQAPIYLSVRR
jgi:uncharacterized protein (TIGR03437 family)